MFMREYKRVKDMVSVLFHEFVLILPICIL